MKKKQKTNIERYQIPYRSEKWHQFRLNGIGASEVRTVLYADDYSDPLVLFYQKLGFKKPIKDNEAMFHGRNLEEYVAMCWQGWDGKKDEYNNPSYINNINNGKIIRRCKKLNAIVKNKMYDWLFVNVDRMINKKGGFSLITGKPLEKEGVLEIKTIEGFSAAKWEAGIDPSYLTQLNTALLLLEADYGELAILKNGRYLDVFPFEINYEICELIIDQTYKFWYDHVLPAKKWVEQMEKAQMVGDEQYYNECKHQIQMLEPKVGSNKTAEMFVKENYRKNKTSIMGSETLLKKGKKDAYIASIISTLNEIKQKNKNEILIEFLHNNCEYIDFEEEGNLRYFVRKGSTLPQLGNNLKQKFNKNQITELIQKNLLKNDFF